MKYLQSYILALVVLYLAVASAYPAEDIKEERIVGGHRADISQHPHQISMRYKSLFSSKSPYSHRCGGSIIAAEWVLTAAHCIIQTVPSQFQIIAGTNNRRGVDGVIVPVAEIIMHSQYNPENFDYDIALLKLGAPLPLNNFTIKAIELGEDVPLNGAISTTTGWGTTAQGGIASNDLLEVHVPIVNNTICDADYGGNSITDRMLCAGVRGEGGKDACQGDSGGPLIIRNRLYGVVSWGYGCAQPDYPGVYSSVPNLLPWIKANVNGK